MGRLGEIGGVVIALAIVAALSYMCWQRYTKYSALVSTQKDFEKIVAVFQDLPAQSKTLRRVVLHKIKGPSFVSASLLPRIMAGTSLRVEKGQELTVVHRVRPRKRGRPRVTLRVSLLNKEAGVEYRFLKVNSFESKWVVQHEQE